MTLIIETVDPDGTPRSIILDDEFADTEVPPAVQAEVDAMVERLKEQAKPNTAK